MDIKKSCGRYRPGALVIMVAAWTAHSDFAFALKQLDNQTATVTPSDTPDSWSLTNNSTLTVTGGAQVLGISAVSSTVNLLNGASSNIAAGAGSAVFIERGAVNASTGTGLALTNSSGSVKDSSIVASNGFGIAITRVSSDVGLTVENSQVTGTTAGIRANNGAVLTVSGSDLLATGTTGVGLFLASSAADITGGSVTGGLNGIQLSSYSDDDFRAGLSLDGTTVVGGTGSALLVSGEGFGVDATITISNGTTLSGGNGTAIEVAELATANINVENAALSGNVTVDGTSSAALALQASQLTGNVVIDQSGSIDLTLQDSRLTGDIQAGPASQVDATLLGSSVMTGDISAEAGAVINVGLAEDSHLVGDMRGGGDSQLNASLAGASSIQGDILAQAQSTVNLGLIDDARLTGSIRSAGNSAVTATLSGNSAMQGDVLAQEGSTITLGLSENARLEGSVRGEANSAVAVTLSGTSSMEGDILSQDASDVSLALNDNATLAGRINGASAVAINGAANWLMTGDSNLGALTLGGGSVTFGDNASFYTLSLASLSGHGTFVMGGDIAAGTTDLLKVSGVATGNYRLLYQSSGADISEDTRLYVVRTGGGDAQFSLVGGAVDLGTWSYDLAKDTEDDWYLDATTRKVSPGARTAIALFNTAPTVWYGELSSLRSRMGELRLSGSEPGGWVRTYGNKYNVADASGVGYQQTQQGISLGIDGHAPFGDGQWLIGAMAGYSKSNLDLNAGTSGTVDSYYTGIYTTWLDEQTGYYLDAVLKLNRFQNQAHVSLSDGDRTKGNYDTMGIGSSVEFGRRFNVADGYFVEPFAQLSSVVIQGRHYALNNGLAADGDRTRSLLAKAGTTFGRTFNLAHERTIQPYLKTAVVHEFSKNNKVSINNNVFNNDLSGSRAEVGAGAAIGLSPNFQLHADMDYSNGSKLEQPWGVNLGLRYNW